MSTNPADSLTLLRPIVIITVISISLIVALVAHCYDKWKKRRSRETGTSPELPRHDLENPDGNNQDNGGEKIYFNLPTLKAATNNFSDANKLGEGGFGPVYKGKLLNGKEIAVKRLSMRSGQGVEEFKNEVQVIMRLQHRNLVRLLGYWGEKDEKLLVYEYLANTSLEKFLFDPENKPLDWDKRANIVTGIAKGIQYLHEDSRLKIIHRDLKPGNILLDDEMNPKISDFGTARIFGSKQIEANTNIVVGTMGYMAPEYLNGVFSTNSDVYSFGILMLEIITGKKNNSPFYPSQRAVPYVYRLWNEGKGQELIDLNMVDMCPVSEALRWIHIALLCVQEDPTDRPSISSVIVMLGSKTAELPRPSAPPVSGARLVMSDQSSSTGAGTGYPMFDESSTSVLLSS